MGRAGWKTEAVLTGGLQHWIRLENQELSFLHLSRPVIHRNVDGQVTVRNYDEGSSEDCQRERTEPSG